MENEFDSKVRIHSSPPTPDSNGGSNRGVLKKKANTFQFRAPQALYNIQEFELGKIYGVGSYSKVVRAKKKDTGNFYALKIMDKKFITKENKTAYVKLERIVLDQLDHPGIVRLYFTFQDAISLYMALECCEGGELFDQIAQKGRLSEDEARFYAAEIVDALEYIHNMGLIHRDIKPENLLLSADGHIKIADFGSVKPINDSKIIVLPNAGLGVTKFVFGFSLKNGSISVCCSPCVYTDDKSSTFVGTAAYIPPELLNSSPATFGNDLWALGCTLYQMLSGISPFKDASEWLIFQKIIARDLKFPNYFSDDARDLIDRLLATDPSKRPGAGPEGYTGLKAHPFFKRVNWSTLRKQSPPALAKEQTAAQPRGNDDAANVNDCNRCVSCLEGAGHATKIASIESFDSKWLQFLEEGETILMTSLVKKMQKLTSKKVQLILTSKPNLIYIDPSKPVLLATTIWPENPNELSIQVTNNSTFKISTPKKVSMFEDPKQRAWQWKSAIEGFQNRDCSCSDTQGTPE